MNYHIKCAFFFVAMIKSLCSMQPRELVLYSTPNGAEITVDYGLWNAAFPGLSLRFQEPTTSPYAVAPTHAIDVSRETLVRIEQLLHAPMREQEMLATLSSQEIRELWAALAKLNCRPTMRIAHSTARALAQSFYHESEQPDFLTYFFHRNQDRKLQLDSIYREWPTFAPDFALYLYLRLNNSERRLCGPYFDTCINPLAYIRECPDETFAESNNTPELTQILQTGIRKRTYSQEDLRDFLNTIIADSLTPFFTQIFQEYERRFRPSPWWKCCSRPHISPNNYLKNAADSFNVLRNNTALTQLLVQRRLISPTPHLLHAYTLGLQRMVHTLLKHGANPLAHGKATNIRHEHFEANMHTDATFSDEGAPYIPLVANNTQQTVLERALLIYAAQKSQYSEPIATADSSAAPHAEASDAKEECAQLRNMCIMMINHAKARWRPAFSRLLQENAWVQEQALALVPNIKELLQTEPLPEDFVHSERQENSTPIVGRNQVAPGSTAP